MMKIFSSQLPGLRYLLTLAFITAVSLVVDPVYAQNNKAGREDFGSETIVRETPSGLLPLELVEEQDTAVTEDSTPVETTSTPTPAQEPKPASKASVEDALEEIAGLSLQAVPAQGSEPAGVRLGPIAPQSILFSLGLRGDDVVRSVNGAQVATAQSLRELLGQGIELASAVLVVVRDDQEVVVPLAIQQALNAVGLDDSTAAGPAGAATSEETTTILNVTDVDVSALIKTFSKLTKRNYILDSSVKGTVTIHLPSPVPVTEALRILDTVLLLKGFSTVPVGENTWKVVSAKDARQTTIPLVTYTDKTSSDAMVTKMVRLKHIAAEDLQQLLAQFVSKDGVINAFDGTNTLILIDSAFNIDRLQELIAELDVPAVDQDMSIIPILHAEAKDIADKINEILGESGEDQSTASNVRAGGIQPANLGRSIRTNLNQAPQSTGATQESVRARSLGFKIIPDERTNSLIVVADTEMTTRVKALVEQLDSEVDRSSGRFYVYRLQHADSEELAEILNTLVGGSGGDTSSTTGGTQGSSLSSRRGTTGTAGGTGVTQQANQARIASALQRSRDLLRQRLTGSQATTTEGRVNLEGEVSIAPDPSTNSLVINASRGDYQKLQQVIAQLDEKRRQVLVEATILEVTLSDEQGFGIELQGTAAFNDAGAIAQTNYGGLTNLLTNPAALTDLTVAAASTGTVTLPGGITLPSQAMLVSAFSRLTNVNVLSAPTIMATDNQEAEIIVGENVPFVTSTSTDTANINNTFNTIERQDVGITLRITPQISSGDFVVLKIFVEISNVVAATRNDPNGPTTTIRTTETEVTVKDGQMVATGGLIQDSVTDATRGVPFLKDIPVFGNFFKRQDESMQKTNLLIFITPKMIKDQFDARLATKDATVPLRKHVQSFDLNPRREEILNSSSIDKVVEQYSMEVDRTPTTITPPAPVVVGGGELAIGTDETNEIVELNVTPVLPGFDSAAPRGSLDARRNDYAQAQQASETIAVLRPLQSGAPTLKALLVRAAPNSPALTHFEVGRVYRSSAESPDDSAVCIGRYGSIEEALTMHPNLSTSTLESLSPAQLMGLGTSSWIAATTDEARN